MQASIQNILENIETRKCELAALDRQIDSCITEAELNRVGAKTAEIESQLTQLLEVARQHAEISEVLSGVEVKIASARKRL